MIENLIYEKNRIRFQESESSDLECKQAKSGLGGKVERFRGILENMDHWIWEVDSKGQYTDCSKTVEKLLGYFPREVIGKTPFDFMPSAEGERVREIFAKIAAAKEPIKDLENWNIRKDGRRVCLLTNGMPIIDAEGELFGFRGIDRDITEYKQAEEKLRESETRLRTIFDISQTGIILVSPQGIITYANRSMAEMFGCTLQELIGSSYLSHLHPDHRDTGALRTRQLIIGEIDSVGYERHYIRSDGTDFWGFLTGRRHEDEHGNLISLVGTIADITKLKTLENDLRQAYKMESIGRLAGGIAHDFNNILSGIFGFSQLAKKHLNDPERAANDIDQIIKGAQKATELVQQILTVSRKSIHEKKPTPVYFIVKDALKLLRATIPTTIGIKETVVSKATVMGDPTQIHQIVMNLCTNAYHAMLGTSSGSGLMSVSLKEIEFNRKDCIPGLDAIPGKYLCLEVSDTGQGMDSTIIKKIFDPYFTTKDPGKGTGLGLAVVFSIVEEHKGYIHVHSEPGKGSTFYVYLPIIDKPPSPQMLKKNGEVHLSGKETIMFVDDEAALREVAYGLMKTLGYTVHSFSSGTQAFDAYKKDPFLFDLVITDMTMPGITGFEMSQKMLELRPEQPIVLCTGYSESIDRERVISMGISEYVEKPFITNELAKIIRKVLDDAKMRR
ncbi:MAG: PAS domain S-box protein [Pseudomonadota bacterium]